MGKKGGRRGTTWGDGWNHGGTEVIRIPAALKHQIMEYARALDCGQVPVDSGQLQTAILLAIDQFVETRLANYHPNQYAKVGKADSRRWDELRKFRHTVADGLTVQSPMVSVHR